MAAEQYANTAKTTLNGAINNSTTSVVASSAAAFPATAPFRILVDQELMLVTAIAVNTFTVTRGIEGTTAVSHLSGTDCTHVLTDESLRRLATRVHLSDVHANRPAAAFANEGDLYHPTDGYSMARSDGGVWVPWGPLCKFTPPVDGQFSWANQGAASVDATRDAITLVAPAQASGSFNYRVRFKTAPATPYTVTVALACDLFDDTAFLKAGLCFRESGSGKLAIYQLRGSGGGQVNYQLNNMASPTSNAGGGQVALSQNLSQVAMWWRIGDNGTNRTFEVSCDGRHFTKVFTDVGRTAFLTADQIGFVCDAANNSGVALRDVNLTLYSWLQA